MYLESLLSLESKVNPTVELYYPANSDPRLLAGELIASLESRGIDVAIHEDTLLGRAVDSSPKENINAVVDGVYHKALDVNVPNPIRVQLITASSKNSLSKSIDHVYLDETDSEIGTILGGMSLEGSGRECKVFSSKEDLMEEMGVLSMEIVEDTI